jgi:hypothetical protein
MPRTLDEIAEEARLWLGCPRERVLKETKLAARYRSQAVPAERVLKNLRRPNVPPPSQPYAIAALRKIRDADRRYDCPHAPCDLANACFAPAIAQSNREWGCLRHYARGTAVDERPGCLDPVLGYGHTPPTHLTNGSGKVTNAARRYSETNRPILRCGRNAANPDSHA